VEQEQEKEAARQEKVEKMELKTNQKKVLVIFFIVLGDILQDHNI
jgi:hypothetical protein